MIEINTLMELKFLNPEKTRIQAFVNNETYITIEKDDDIYTLFDRCVAGEFGEISESEIVYPPTPVEERRAELRCSPLQAKAAMYQNGLLDSVEQLIANSDFIVQLAWKEATVFERNSQIVKLLSASLTWPDGTPITDEDLDNLFEEAMKITF